MRVILINAFITYEVEGDELKDMWVVLLTTISCFLTVQERCLCYSLQDASPTRDTQKAMIGVSRLRILHGVTLRRTYNQWP